MKKSDKYLVTSATGNTGYHVALQLLNKGHSVRVMSRAMGPKIEQLISLGADYSRGAIDDNKAVEKAIKGMTKIYYCYPIIPGLLTNTKHFVEVAQKEKIKTVVNVGQYLSELQSHPSKQTLEHKLSYKVFDDANIGAIHVTPGWFADNALATILFISQLGKFPFPLGDGRCPIVANEDIAAVAVCLLESPDGHTGKRYQPTGPSALTSEDMLDTFEKVLQRKVSHLYMPKFLFRKAVTRFGIQPYMLSQLQLYIESYQTGVFDYEPTDIVKRFTGREPESFDVTVQRYFLKEDLLKRTPKKVWQAIKEFFAISFTSAPRLKVLRELNQAN